MRVDRLFLRLANHVDSMNLKSERARTRVSEYMRIKLRRKTKTQYVYRRRVQLQQVLKELNKTDYSISQKVQHQRNYQNNSSLFIS